MFSRCASIFRTARVALMVFSGIGYAAGNRRIVSAAFVTLGTSVVNNVATAIVERPLIERYPNHRRLVRGLG